VYEAELKTSEGSSHGKVPSLCKFQIQELNQVLTVNIGEKSLYASGRGEKKQIILKYPRTFCFA
jgi:hypothetical protein